MGTRDNPGTMDHTPEPGVTYRLPVHDMREQGLIKQVGPNTWEALVDINPIEVLGDSPLAIMAGTQFYSITHDFDARCHSIRFVYSEVN